MKKQKQSIINEIRKLEKIADDFFENRQYQDAKTAYERVLNGIKKIKKNKPTYNSWVSKTYNIWLSHIYIMLGHCNKQLNDLDQAYFNFNQAIQHDNKCDDANNIKLIMVSIGVKLKKFDDVKYLLDDIISQTKNNDKPSYAKALFLFTNLAEEGYIKSSLTTEDIIRNYEEAAKYFHEENEVYHFLLFKRARKKGDFETAQEHLAQAFPSDSYYYKGNLANILIGEETHQSLLQAIDLFNEIVDKCDQKEFVAIAAFGLAKLYDEGKGIERNPTKAIELYNQSSKLGYREAHYRLGCKYENGEDVEKNLDRAINFFLLALAVKQNDSAAGHHLGECHFQKGNYKASEKWLKKAAQDGHIKAFSELGDLYYFQRKFELAFKNWTLAANRGCLLGSYHKGIAYYYGIGTQKNIDKAKKCFLRVTEDIPEASFYLAIIDSENRDYFLHKAAEHGDPEALKIVTTAPAEEPEKVPKIEPAPRVNIYNNAIDSIWFDDGLSPEQKIRSIIAKCDISNLSEPFSYALIVKRIGTLINKIHDKKLFLQYWLPNIFEVVLNNHQTGDFHPIALTNLIEGVSKTHFTKNDKLQDFVIELYRKANEKKEQFYWQHLITIIFSSIHFQYNQQLTDLILPLIDMVFENIKKGQYNLQGLTNFVYSLAVLDSSGSTIIHDKLSSLLQLVISKCDTSENKGIRDLHQAYLVCSYFQSNFSNIIMQETLDNWEKQLNGSQEKPVPSKFQQQVTSFIEKYFVLETEKRFNCLPVDICVKENDQIIIIQADGPPHFLHCLNNPDPHIYTNKDSLHDDLLERKGFIIHVPYFEWNELKSDDEKYEYFQNKFAIKGLTFPEKHQTWTPVGKQSQLLTNVGLMRQPKAPVADSATELCNLEIKP